MSTAPGTTTRANSRDDGYRLLFENSHDAVLLTAPDGRVLRANAEACRMFDMTESEICAAGRARLVDLSDPRLAEQLAERSRTGHSGGSLRFLRRGGIPFEAEAWSAVFTNEFGEFRTWITIRDVSQRVSAEQQVRQLTAVFAAQAEAAPDGIVVFDPSGNVLAFNRRFLAIWGLDAGTVAGGRDEITAAMTRLAGDSDELRQAVTSDPALDLVSLRAEVTLPGGRTISCHSAPLWAAATYLGRAWYHRDVTAIKKAEVEARTSAATLATQFDASPDGILLVDETGRVASFNQRLLDIWGIPASALEADRAARFAAVENQLADPVQFAADAARLAEANLGPSLSAEVAMRDGRSLEMHVSRVALEGEPLGLVWYFRDVTAIKKAEVDARTSAAILAAQFDASPEGVLAVDSNSQVVTYNSRLLDMWNFTEADMKLDRSARLDLIRPLLADPDAFVALVEDQIANPDAPREAEILLADGRIYEQEVRPLDLPAGPGIAWFYRDITGQKLIERSLRRSEEQFRDAFEHAPIGMSISTAAGTRLRVNRALCELLGHSEADLLAGSALPFNEVGSADPEASLRRQLADGAISQYDAERRYRHHDGNEIRALASVSLVRGGRDEAPLLLTQVIDVTQARRAEEALRESEQRLRSVLNSAVDGIVVIDRSGIIEAFNPAAESIFGYGATELLGRNVSTLMPSPFREEHDSYIQRYLATGEPHIIGGGREVTGRRKDGSTFPLDLAVAEMPGEDGLRFVGTIRDITERKRSEEALVHAQKAESLGVLAGGIAHQLNNLLASIMGNAGFVAMQTELGTAQAEALRDIETASARATGLAASLLSYAGRAPVAPAVTDLAAVATEVAGLLRPALSGQAEIECGLEGALPVLIDPARAREAIAHLLMNAGEAVAGQQGTVRLKGGVTRASRRFLQRGFLPHALEPGDYVHIEVTDNGPGIPPEALPRIFDPFFTTKFMGRGLGLAAVLGIVRGAGGAIKVTSTPGRGTAFLLLFPLARAG